METQEVKPDKKFNWFMLAGNYVKKGGKQKGSDKVEPEHDA